MGPGTLWVVPVSHGCPLRRVPAAPVAPPTPRRRCCSEDRWGGIAPDLRPGEVDTWRYGFQRRLDRDGDGRMDETETRLWVLPDVEEQRVREAEHLLTGADQDQVAPAIWWCRPVQPPADLLRRVLAGGSGGPGWGGGWRSRVGARVVLPGTASSRSWWGGQGQVQPGEASSGSTVRGSRRSRVGARGRPLGGQIWGSLQCVQEGGNWI